MAMPPINPISTEIGGRTDRPVPSFVKQPPEDGRAVESGKHGRSTDLVRKPQLTTLIAHYLF